MALTASNMLPLATLAPDFSLLDTVSGKVLSLSGLKSDLATVIMFLCNHCPYVKHVNSELVRLAQEYQEQGAAFVAISSNDARNYPEDGPERMKIQALQEGYRFPYLHDSTQVVARAYQAACTPDFFAFDGGMKLAYRGRLDDSSPGNGKPLTGKDLRVALDAIIAGRPVPVEQHPSMGCNIKWAK